MKHALPNATSISSRYWAVQNYNPKYSVMSQMPWKELQGSRKAAQRMQTQLNRRNTQSGQNFKHESFSNQYSLDESFNNQYSPREPFKQICESDTLQISSSQCCTGRRRRAFVLSFSWRRLISSTCQFCHLAGTTAVQFSEVFQISWDSASLMWSQWQCLLKVHIH